MGLWGKETHPGKLLVLTLNKGVLLLTLNKGGGIL